MADLSADVMRRYTEPVASQDLSEDIMRRYSPEVSPGDNLGAFTGGLAGGLTEGLPTVAGAYMGGQIGSLGGPAAPLTIPLGVILGGLAGHVAGSGIRERLSEVKGPVTGAPLMTKSTESLPQESRPYGVAGEFIGGGLPIAGLPVAAAAKGITAAGPVGKMLETAGRKPLAFLGAETGGLTSGGMAGGVAEEQAPGRTGIRTAAEIAGGVLSPGRILYLGASAVKSGWQAVAGRFNEGARQDAASVSLRKVIEEFGGSPEGLVKAIGEDDLPMLKRTAAQMTGSPALIALESKLSQESAKFGAESKQMADQSMLAIRAMIADLEKTGSPDAFIQAAKMKEGYFKSLLSARLAVAAQEAQRTAAKITTDTPAVRAELSRRVSEIMENALGDARKAESELWGQIPRNRQAFADNILAAGKEVRDGLLKEESLPAVVEGFMARMAGKTGMPDQTTLGEVTLFRSRMLALARQAGANKQFDDARIYGKMAEAALDDMAGATITAEEGATIDAARTFSRELHDTFTRTFAGATLATGATGARRIPPELVMRHAFSSPGEKAALRFSQMEEAAGFTAAHGAGTPESTAAMEGLLDAQKRITRLAAADTIDPMTGRVNPARLTKFVRNNEEVLNRFPEIAADLRSASTAEKAFRNAEQSGAQAIKAIEQKAIFSKIVGAEDPAKVIAQVINGPTPMKDLSQMVRLAQRGGDDAVAGLRSSIFEYADRIATSASGDFSFAAYKNALTRSIGPGKPNLVAMMSASGVLRPEDSTRYLRLLNEAEKIESASRGGYRLKGELSESSAYFNFIQRIVGAKIGAKMPLAKESGSTLVGAGAGSRMVQNVMDKIPIERTRDVLIEAAKEPKLMAALLERVKTAGDGIKIGRQIHAYLWQAGLLQPEQEQQ